MNCPSLDRRASAAEASSITGRGASRPPARHAAERLPASLEKQMSGVHEEEGAYEDPTPPPPPPSDSRPPRHCSS